MGNNTHATDICRLPSVSNRGHTHDSRIGYRDVLVLAGCPPLYRGWRLERMGTSCRSHSLNEIGPRSNHQAVPAQSRKELGARIYAKTNALWYPYRIDNCPAPSNLR